MMLVSDDDLQVLYDIRDQDLFSDEWFMELLANAGVDIERISGSTDFIYLCDKGEHAVFFDDFRSNASHISTDVGEFSLFYADGEQGVYGLYHDGEELIVSDTSNEFDIGLVILRNGEKITSCSYTIPNGGTLEDAVNVGE